MVHLGGFVPGAAVEDHMERTCEMFSFLKSYIIAKKQISNIFVIKEQIFFMKCFPKSQFLPQQSADQGRDGGCGGFQGCSCYDL